MYNVRQRLNIGSNLRYLRNLKGLTLQELSKETNIPRGTLGAYESYGEIGPVLLKILCDFYNVKEGWLIMKPDNFIKKLEAE